MRGYRAAIVNPQTSFSRRIRELLQDRAFPLIELKLFENRNADVSSITKFEDQIVVTQPLDRDMFPHLDLIFFDGEGQEELDKEALAAAKEGLWSIAYGIPDLHAPVVATGINEKSISRDDRLIVAAHTPSILAGSVLAAFKNTLEIAEASATIILPASDMGDEAAKELYQQVLSILNFKPVPSKILGEELAFNVISADQPDAPGIRSAVVGKEVARIAELEIEVPVAQVRAPVFHGYALSLWIRFSEKANLEDIVKILKSSRKVSYSPSKKRTPGIPTPLSVTDSDKIHIGMVRSDETNEGGFWIWAVADSLAVDAAASAVRLAEKLLGVKRSLK